MLRGWGAATADLSGFNKLFGRGNPLLSTGDLIIENYVS